MRHPRRLLGILLCGLAATACGGSSTKNGTPVPGEGSQCQAGSQSCDQGQSCVAFSGYASAFEVCRTNCGTGCSNAEACNAVTSDMTCQCTPTLTPGEAGDPCVAFGLLCNPDFHVCAAKQPVGTECPTGEQYSRVWSLCLVF